MDYPTFRRKGWPIGSGVTESAVNQFNKRVKGTEPRCTSGECAGSRIDPAAPGAMVVTGRAVGTILGHPTGLFQGRLICHGPRDYGCIPKRVAKSASGGIAARRGHVFQCFENAQAYNMPACGAGMPPKMGCTRRVPSRVNIADCGTVGRIGRRRVGLESPCEARSGLRGRVIRGLSGPCGRRTADAKSPVSA